MNLASPVPRRHSPLAGGVFLCALAGLVATMAIGLPHLRDAPTIARAAVPHSTSEWIHGPATFDLWSRLFGRLMLAVPLADAATRLSVLSAVMAAVTLGLWVRAGVELAYLVRPQLLARTAHAAQNDPWHELVAVLGSVFILGLSKPFFELAATPGGASASLMMFAGWMVAASLLLKDCTSHRASLNLAALAGLVTATSPAVGVLVVPPTVVLWVWGLRKSARWALLMPLAFFVGFSVLVAAAFAQGLYSTFGGWWATLTLAPLRHAMRLVNARAWWLAVGGLVDQVGVVSGLLILLGLGVIVFRRPGVAALISYALWATAMMAAGSGLDAAPVSDAQDASWPLGAWAGVAVLPLLVGILHFASKLGRAKVPATVALVIIAAVAPVLCRVSGPRGEDRLTFRLLTQAQWKIAPRSEVDTGSEAMSLVFEFGRAIGVRPDLRGRRAKQTSSQ